MTSNLLISAFDIPLNAIYIQPPYGMGVNEDNNQYNLISKHRYHFYQSDDTASWGSMRFDLGSAATTKSANHLIIARADIMKTAGVSQIVLRGSSSFAPEQIAGLTAWYDANRGITKDGSDLVSQWNDLSGNGYHVTQSSTKRPLWKSPTNGINDNCAILFDGSNDCMNNTALGSLFTGSDIPHSVFAVIKRSSTATGDVFVGFGNTGAGGDIQYEGRPTNYRVRKIDDAALTVDVTGGTQTTNTVVWSSIHTGTSVSAWIDGANIINATAQDVANTGTNVFTIGAVNSGGSEAAQFDGYIGEVLIFNVALGTTDRQAIENYLIAKWETAAVHKNTSFSSATLYGPRSNDYLGEFTASTAYRWWELSYYGTAQTFCQSKNSFGTAFDLGNVSSYEIDRIPAKEARFYTDSGVEYQNRMSEEIYRITCHWKHVSIATATDFMNKIARYAHRASYFLYTTAAGGVHDPLDSQRVLHCKIVPGSIERKIELYNYEDISVTFEEILG